MAGFVHYNNTDWIKENEQQFLPPVCNKMMHDTQLKVFFVGGPNTRKDFHIEEGEEFFYMVKGDMNLIVMENGVIRDVHIKEGEVFMLPAKIPHSPQRLKDTVGLVIERERLPNEKDCLRYFVEGSTDILFEKWFYCESLGSQLKVIIKEYFDSEQFRTGQPIPGTITDSPPFVIDGNRKLESPFSLQQWIKDNKKEIKSSGKLRLFKGRYESDVLVIGEGEFEEVAQPVEHWIWQIEGDSMVKLGDQQIQMKKDDSLLIKPNSVFKQICPKDSISLRLKMNPKNKL